MYIKENRCEECTLGYQLTFIQERHKVKTMTSMYPKRLEIQTVYQL